MIGFSNPVYRLIPLSQGLFARVSPEDYERISEFKWCVCFEGSSRKPYAVRFEEIGKSFYVVEFVKIKRKWVPRNVLKRQRRKIKMHREVLKLPPFSEKDLVAHHMDGDGLNNTRENLQAVTYSQNSVLKARKVVEPWL